MRALARIFAFKIIFSQLFIDGSVEEAKNEFPPEENLDEKGKKFAESIIDAFLENKQTIEEKLKNALEKFDYERVYKVDLALLSLALTEILYIGTPKAVVINEVLEISKKYSTEKSSGFINGVLAKI